MKMLFLFVLMATILLAAQYGAPEPALGRKAAD